MNHFTELNRTNGLEIAIVGLTGRFPGAQTIEAFWQNLREGVESISTFSTAELEAAEPDPAVLHHPNYVNAKGILNGIEEFDNAFFDLNPREAEIMDPQHRLFLECAWEALESANCDAETYPGLIGVYAGVGMNTYLLNNLFPNRHLLDSVGGHQIVIANDKDFLATRTAYKLNLKGPSLTVQTACSTSLVAVHLACQGLLSGECDMALAGGISLSLPHKVGYVYHEGGIVSPDGHCRAFDAQAQGTVSSEGVGIVVLKRLADAVADGDHIYAVIKGSAINNDGALKVGYTAPQAEGQAAVIQAAQAMAEIEPETVTYIETHGTGTVLGDPIEIAALTQAFRAKTDKTGFCAIGSLKTNIGHLDTAAGVAGLIKTVLALHHKLLPPSLHFEHPNPQIDFAHSPFYVNTQLATWKTDQLPRRAGVSSFGIGGTNAHVVLEEAPPLESDPPFKPWHLLLLSAKTSAALETETAHLAAHLQQNPTLNMADVAYTLQMGRKAFNYRRAVVCRTLDEAVTALNRMDSQRVATGWQARRDPPVAFLFPGQGAQYANMAQDLYQGEPTFRDHIDSCAEQLKAYLGLDLRTVLYPNAEDAVVSTQRLKQTAIAQPALFVTEYALAQLWMSWGIQPQAMMGHSIGEYVAACLAGVFSLEDALKLIAARGHMMQDLTSGAMLTVALSEAEVQPLLGPELSLAAINDASGCTLSGAIAAIDALEQQLSDHGVFSRRLQTSHAFHSQMMDPIVAPFTDLMGRILLNPPQIPYLSNVTGTWITAEEATDPQYWAKHLRQPVRFAPGVDGLLQDPHRLLLEVGPGNTLSTLARRSAAKGNESIILSSLRHPQEQRSDMAFWQETLGKLWLAGVQIHWPGVYAHERRLRLPLPTYPFERQRYWIEAPLNASVDPSRPVLLDKKADLGDWFYMPSWKRAAPPPLLQVADRADARPCWLVFIDVCGVGSALVKQLETLGHDAIAVTLGQQFSRIGENLYTLRLEHPGDYDALLTSLRALGKTPQKIAHLWSVTSSASRQIDDFEPSQELGFYSLLYLAQALGKQQGTDPVHIGVVSNQIQPVLDGDALCPEKATILGPCQTIPQEYPYISCRSIDIALPSSEPQAAQRLVNQLIAELAAPASDTVVAYRGRHRWVQSVEPVRLEKAVVARSLVRERGVYLITGGLGGIGLVLAEYLARTVQARLILIGRSIFPERDTWSNYLATHDAPDPISDKIRQLQTLEDLGAQVLVQCADVTHLAQMQAATAQAEAHFGKIHGIIHAAGIAGGGTMQLKTAEAAAKILAPKVRGTQILDALFQDRKLDFWVLCSSLSSLMGAFGQADYCAANAFLDAFAHRKSASAETFTISINWDAWQNVGMAATTAVPSGLEAWREQHLKKGILPVEGMEVFSRILGNPLPQLPQWIVSTQDFQAAIQQDHRSALSTALTHLVQLSLSGPSHPRPPLQNAYVAPRNEIEQTLVGMWQDLLGIEHLGVFDNFFELGGHSLLVTQLLSRIRDTFETKLPLNNLFEANTIAQLAELIEEEILKAIEDLSEEEVKELI